MSTVPESQPSAAELQSQVDALRQRLDYVLAVMAAMCREARTEHLMAANGSAPARPRHLSAVR